MMKTTIKRISQKTAFLGLLFLTPSLLFASTTGGGAISSELQIVTILNQIIEFVTGPVAVLFIILGFIVGAGTIAVARQNDASGWQRIGKVIVGGAILFGAVGIANLFFAGAVI